MSVRVESAERALTAYGGAELLQDIGQLNKAFEQVQRRAFTVAGVTAVTLDFDSTYLFNRSTRRQGVDRTYKKGYRCIRCCASTPPRAPRCTRGCSAARPARRPACARSWSRRSVAFLTA